MRSGPTALRTAQRNLLPLPAIAAAAVKFGGAAMLKKVALSKVIQKVGPDKVLGELKTLNGRLRSSGGRYGADVADAAEDSLSALERSLTTLRGDERVGALWGWYSRLEKDNPTLAAAILKSWMETLPGAKWASALMGGSNTSNSGTSDTGSGSGMTQSLKWAVKFHRVRSCSMVEGAVLGQPLRLFWPPGSGVAGTGLLSAPRRSS